MRRLPPVTLLCLAALAGCGRHAGPGATSAPSKLALNAGGEPQWSAQLRDGRIGFADGAQTSLSAPARLADHGGAGMDWTARVAAPKGQAPSTLVLHVAKASCHDADTGMAYPYVAAVAWAGRRFVGCAAPPGQGLGPRR